MTVRALPYQRFKDPEVQRAFDALSQAIQEGNGERGDPKNRWLTVNDAFNGVLTTLILGGGDGSGSPSGAGGLLPPGGPGGGGFTPVGPVIDAIIADILKDPFFIFLGDKINLLSGPPDMTGSINNLIEQANNSLKEAKKLLGDALDQQGSSITTLQNTTSDQAQQITTIQTNVAGNSSAIVTLNQTTATQATSITALGTRASNSESAILTLNQTTATQATQINTLSTRTSAAESSITQLNQTTATQATSLTNLTTRTANAESSISNLMSTTPTSAAWWQGLSTDVGNAKSNISNLMSTTPTNAQWWSSLKTSVDNSASQIVTLNQTTSNSSTKIDQLTTTVGNHTTAIQQQASTLYDPNTGLWNAQYSVKVQDGDKVAGFGLASSTGLGSRFYIRADRFAIADPSGVSDANDPRVPFIVQNGTVYIKRAMIEDASIDSAKIASLDAGKVTFGQMSGDRINVNTLYADRIVSNSIAKTDYYNQSGTRSANGQTQDLALSWGYGFKAAPYTSVLLRLDLGMATAITQTQVYWEMWSVNGWYQIWYPYYKGGAEISSRYLFSSTMWAVTVPANQFAWFNVRATANSVSGGYFGYVDMFITEQRA